MASSVARAARPVYWAAIMIRSRSSCFMSWSQPWFCISGPPMIMSFGTRTSSKKISKSPMISEPIFPSLRCVMPGVSVGELLRGEAEFEAVAAGAPVLLGKGQAEEAGLLDLGDELEGVTALVVGAPVVIGRALPLDEVADHLAERLLVVGELEVHLS